MDREPNLSREIIAEIADIVRDKHPTLSQLLLNAEYDDQKLAALRNYKFYLRKGWADDGA